MLQQLLLSDLHRQPVRPQRRQVSVSALRQLHHLLCHVQQQSQLPDLLPHRRSAQRQLLHGLQLLPAGLHQLLLQRRLHGLQQHRLCAERRQLRHLSERAVELSDLQLQLELPELSEQRLRPGQQRTVLRLQQLHDRLSELLLEHDLHLLRHGLLPERRLLRHLWLLHGRLSDMYFDVGVSELRLRLRAERQHLLHLRLSDDGLHVLQRSVHLYGLCYWPILRSLGFQLRVHVRLRPELQQSVPTVLQFPGELPDVFFDVSVSELQLELRSEQLGVHGLQQSDDGVFHVFFVDGVHCLQQQLVRPGGRQLPAVQRGHGRLCDLQFCLDLHLLFLRLHPGQWPMSFLCLSDDRLSYVFLLFLLQLLHHGLHPQRLLLRDL